MEFNEISFTDLGDIVARVDRNTGNLEINNEIWGQLPPEYKEFVLLHEAGHLVLKTQEEHQANTYAIGKYLESAAIDNQEFNKRIIILSEILSDEGRKMFRRRNYDNLAGDPVSAAAEGLGSIFDILPALGIGSKARSKEAQANAQAQSTLLAAKAKADGKTTANKILIISIGAGMLALVLVLFFTLKK